MLRSRPYGYTVLFRLSFGLVLILTPELKADEKNEPVEDDLSLGELFSLASSVASKKSMRLAETPGVVSVFTQQDIDKLSLYTISDMARITPGYSAPLQASNIKALETRGQNSSTYASKHLILIDGIPVNFTRGYMVHSEEQLPLLFADKVELLRGPASALYGTGAFLGVVKVSSPNLSERGSRWRSMVGVSDTKADKRQVLASYSNNYGAGQVDINVGSHKRFGSEQAMFGLEPTKEPTTNMFMNGREDSFLYVRSSNRAGLFQGLDAGFINYSTRSGTGDGWGANAQYPLNIFSYRQFLYYLKYSRELSPNLRWNSYVVKGDGFEYGSVANDAWKGSQPLYWFQYEVDFTNEEYLTELNAQLDDVDIIVGVNVDRRRTPPDRNHGTLNSGQALPRALAATSKTDSAYLQLEKPVEWLGKTIFTAGARYDRGSTAVSGRDRTFEQLSPRFAIVQKLSDTWSVKLLDGSALRAPGTNEYGHTNEKSRFLIMENYPDLKAETIHSQELSLTYQGADLLGSLTLFKNVTRNRMEQAVFEDKVQHYTDPVGAGNQPGVFQNLPGEIRGQGLEAEVSYLLSRYKLSLNYATADTRIADAFLYSPVGKTNFIMTYDGKSSPLGMDAGLTLHNTQYWIAVDGRRTPGNTNMNLDLEKYVTDATKFGIHAENLLDRTYYYPRYTGDAYVPEVRRTLMLTAKSDF